MSPGTSNGLPPAAPVPPAPPDALISPEEYDVEVLLAGQFVEGLKLDQLLRVITILDSTLCQESVFIEAVRRWVEADRAARRRKRCARLSLLDGAGR